MTNNYEFGLLVRKHREQQKLSREKLAEMCNISDRCIGNIERGNSIPKFDTAMKLCYYCHIDVGDLSMIQDVILKI